jgi:hypothetical protein
MKVYDGFSFADSILKPEQALEILDDSLEFFAYLHENNPEYLEFFVANLALNIIGRIDYEEGVGTIFPDYELVYEKAKELVSLVDMERFYLQTDIESGHSFCGSPWDHWTKDPAQYATLVESFRLQTSESTINYSEYPCRVDEVINLLEANRVKYGMSKSSVYEIVNTVSYLDLDCPDYDLAPKEVYDRLKSYIDNLPE